MLVSNSSKKKRRVPKFVAYVASSIDGRISLHKIKRPNWTSREDWDFFQKELAKADAVVVGRNTYIAAQKRLRSRNTFVLTSRVNRKVEKGTVTFVNPTKTALADTFAPYKRVAIVGGSRVYHTMLTLGLLEDLYVSVEPLILGRGTSMFEKATKTHRMKLVHTRRLNDAGTLLLHYVVQKHS